jgi:hypothetical protein
VTKSKIDDIFEYDSELLVEDVIKSIVKYSEIKQNVNSTTIVENGDWR